MTTFSNRHEIETYLASLVTDGVIVEIGCGFGNGIIALDKGNLNHHLPIYGIDPYLEYHDPLGGNYGPDTKTAMKLNTDGIDFNHIEKPALEAIKEWSLPIGLLWVDLSMPYQSLRQVVSAWHKYIQTDGYLAITGLCYDQLGTRQIANELIVTGDYEMVIPNNLVAILKKKEPMIKRCVFYIAADYHVYANEAAYSAESVRRQLGVNTYLFTTENVKQGLNPALFTDIIQLPARKFEGWYLNQVWYFNQAVDYLRDYNQLLYLDTDTYVCRDCSGVWDILNHYDMALGHAAGRGATPTAVNCPPEFATLGVGVNFFRNNPAVCQLFDDWLKMFQEHYIVYGETDEGPFRDLLFLNKHNVSYYVLAPEEHCRFGFGVWLNGSASILHGRVPTPLAQVAEEINEVKTMRLYRYGNGILWHHVPQ